MIIKIIKEARRHEAAIQEEMKCHWENIAAIIAEDRGYVTHPTNPDDAKPYSTSLQPIKRLSDTPHILKYNKDIYDGLSPKPELQQPRIEYTDAGLDEGVKTVLNTIIEELRVFERKMYSVHHMDNAVKNLIEGTLTILNPCAYGHMFPNGMWNLSSAEFHSVVDWICKRGIESWYPIYYATSDEQIAFELEACLGDYIDATEEDTKEDAQSNDNTTGMNPECAEKIINQAIQGTGVPVGVMLTECSFVTEDEARNLDQSKWGLTQVANGYIKWERHADFR